MIAAYTPLHYGKHYLQYAVESVASVVDRHIILYTPKPSYGYSAGLQCPDSEEELRACVEGFPHVEWYTGQWTNESQHRAAAMKHLAREHILVPVDADEIWPEDALRAAIESACSMGERQIRVYGFVHLWRSFGYACTDMLAPVRLINLGNPGGQGHLWSKVYHFGYAQPLETIKYKWSCHGHQAELRDGWLDRFEKWEPGQGDAHPTNVDFWQPQQFDKGEMPELLRAHPFYDLELI